MNILLTGSTGYISIDTLDVLEAAGTKWNFLPFGPGLVGGHCISFGHQQFKDLGAAGIRALAKPNSVIYDVKHILPRDAVDGRL